MARKMKTQKRRKYKRGGGLFDGEMFKSKPGRTYSQYFGFTEETPTLAQSVGLQPQPPSQPQTFQSSVGLNGGQMRRHASSRAGSKRRSRRTRRTRKTRKGCKK